MRLVIISDTHGLHADVKVPDGDVLIHCGDCTNDIGQASLRDFLTWFESHSHKHKILIAGNHDGAFQKWTEHARLMVKQVSPSTTYLEDSGITIDGIRFWGSPFTPTFFDWYFNRDRGESIRFHWNKIPDDTDVLITHGPPIGILDKTFTKESAGCKDLYEAVLRVRPIVHCFGHIHYSYGQSILVHDTGTYTDLINASICGENYKPDRNPVVYDLAT